MGLPIGFDIEGVTKRRVDFFSHGLVGEAVTDLATAAVLGRPQPVTLTSPANTSPSQRHPTSS